MTCCFSNRNEGKERSWLTRSLGDKKPIIVFITSKRDYAVDAFELNVADYIVKPITPSRFLQSVEKAREIYNSNKADVTVGGKEFVFFRDNGILKRLLVEDIDFLEAMGDYVQVFTQQKFHAVHTTLKKLEENYRPINSFVYTAPLLSPLVKLIKVKKVSLSSTINLCRWQTLIATH